MQSPATSWLRILKLVSIAAVWFAAVKLTCKLRLNEVLPIADETRVAQCLGTSMGLPGWYLLVAFFELELQKSFAVVMSVRSWWGSWWWWFMVDMLCLLIKWYWLCNHTGNDDDGHDDDDMDGGWAHDGSSPASQGPVGPAWKSMASRPSAILLAFVVLGYPLASQPGRLESPLIIGKLEEMVVFMAKISYKWRFSLVKAAISMGGFSTRLG